MLILSVVLVGAVATANVEQQVKRARPDMDSKSVKYFAKQIRLACSKHKIPCEIFTAILIQESRLYVDAVNVKTQDYGIGQINVKTIKALGINQDRLTYDLIYSLDMSAKVLSWFYKTYRNETLWYCRYNTGTAAYNIIEASCLNYGSKVNSHISIALID